MSKEIQHVTFEDGTSVTISTIEASDIMGKHVEHSQAELEAAFAKIRNAEHWKDEINVRVPFDEYELAREACIHFTATDLNINSTDEDAKVYVCYAVGYWMGPAGDH